MSSSYLLFFTTLTILCITTSAQGRAPHGLVYENPMAFPPSAVDFFHPDAKKNECGKSGCSPLPVAAQVHATDQYESKALSSDKGKSGIAAGGIACIVFGLGFVALLVMGAYYVVTIRKKKAFQDQSQV